MNFEQWLRAASESTSARKRKAKRVLKLLDEPDSPRRTRILARIERHVAAQLGLNLPSDDPTKLSAFDWSSVDWVSIFETIFKFILALLPFLV